MAPQARPNSSTPARPAAAGARVNGTEFGREIPAARRDPKVFSHCGRETLLVRFGGDDRWQTAATAEDPGLLDPHLQLFIPVCFTPVRQRLESEKVPAASNAFNANQAAVAPHYHAVVIRKAHRENDLM